MQCATKSRDGAQTLTDYCAGTLEDSAVEALEAHLHDCAACRRVVDAQREVWSALGQWTPPQVSADFDARLYARIQQEQQIPAWRRAMRRWFQPAVPWTAWKPAVSIAAACLVVALGFVVRVPDSGDSKLRVDRVDLEQVEEALEDLDLLTPGGAAPAN